MLVEAAWAAAKAEAAGEYATAQSLYSAVVFGVFLGALLYASGWLYASFAGAAYLPMALVALTGVACAVRLLTESPTVQVTPPVAQGP